MPWIQGPQGAPLPPHVCSPPRRWPWLSRRRHPSGAVWECDRLVPLGQGVRGGSNACGRRWRLKWRAYPPDDCPTSWFGGRLLDAAWTEVARVGEGGRPPASLKMLAEDLCRHQARDGWPQDIAASIAALLELIEWHRPLGPNGKHGNRHTATCGCEDK